MNVSDDFIIKEPYQPSSLEQDAINELSRRGLKAHYWESRKRGIMSFKENLSKYMIEQQNCRCAYCRTKIYRSCSFIDREHIIPKSKHPDWTFHPQNICISCQVCNNIKGEQEVLRNPLSSSFPTSSGDYNIVNPFLDKYSDHISILDDMVYVGITEKGKSTIRLCKLYRENLVLDRAEKKMEKENPDSVKYRLLSLLSNNDEYKEVRKEVEKDIIKIVKNYIKD